MATRQIYGTVDRSGNLISGNGFNVQKLQEGTYVVMFEKPFQDAVTPVATVYGPPWQTFNMSIAIVEIIPDSFICLTSTPDRPVDCGFTFTVIGEE